MRSSPHQRPTVRAPASQLPLTPHAPRIGRHPDDRKDTVRLGPFRRACRPWEIVVGK